MVFRNGTIFDIFENDKINADTLLKGMFGQTAGISQTTISNKSDLSSSPIQNKSIDTNKVKEKKIIKIENFAKENTNNNKTKIKIKTF
jgi:hypothetical protein